MTGRPPSKATVLLVDDDPVIATMYGVGLERAGYRVVVANDGRAALELASRAKPDLIILDIRMPVLDGIEVLERLTAEGVTQRTPVVMLSNRKEAGVMERAISLGAKEYLVKLEITPPQVAAVVGRWLAAAHAEA